MVLSISSGLRVSISNASGASQWRKESVTIIESQEPMEEDGEENEGDVESDGVEREESDMRGRGRGREEGQFLSVPCQTITASSSAETLTDSTLTAPSTPTRSRVGSDPADEPDCSYKQTKIISVLL